MVTSRGEEFKATQRLQQWNERGEEFKATQSTAEWRALGCPLGSRCRIRTLLRWNSKQHRDTAVEREGGRIQSNTLFYMLVEREGGRIQSNTETQQQSTTMKWIAAYDSAIDHLPAPASDHCHEIAPAVEMSCSHHASHTESTHHTCPDTQSQIGGDEEKMRDADARAGRPSNMQTNT